MIEKISLLTAVLIVGASSLVLAVQVTAQTIGEENDSSLEGTISENNTIILNAAEVGGNETAEQGEDEAAEQVESEMYRWVDSAGTENPHLNMVSNTEYTIRIDNPTDEEHELIITSESDGKQSAIAEGPEIEPGDNGEFKFTASQAGELGYHCEYHPDQMNGTITVS